MTSPRPTHDLQAERAAIVMLVSNGSVEIANLLTGEDFFDEVHRDIFLSAREIFEKYETCDFVALCHNLEGHAGVTQAGGSTFLAEIFTEFTPDNPIPTIDILKNMRVLRERRGTVDKMGKSSPQELPSLLIEEGKRYAELIPKKSVIDIDELITEITMNEDTYSTGYSEMDAILDGGFTDGMLFVIAAQTSVGKTTLATCIMGHLLSQGTPTHFISLEMSRKHVLIRMLASMSQSSSKEVKENVRSLLEAIETQYYIDIGTNDLKSIQAQVLSSPSKVIIIDYMDLITSSSKESRMMQIDEISRAMKSLAVHSNKTIVLLRQLNRDSQKAKENREPQLSDLYGAGEKDADVISFLWDPHAKDTKEDKKTADIALSLDGQKRDDTKREIHWIVRKNRNGPLGEIRLSFNPLHYSMVENPEFAHSPLL